MALRGGLKRMRGMGGYRSIKARVARPTACCVSPEYELRTASKVQK